MRVLLAGIVAMARALLDAAVFATETFFCPLRSRWKVSAAHHGFEDEIVLI